MPHAPYPLAQRFWKLVDKTGECWLWTGARQRSGYGHLTDQHRTLAAHRVSWELTNGPIPPGLWVCHRCDNPPCVRPDHLFLGTHSENACDAARKGRLYLQRGEAIRRGERAPKAKLTADAVRDIRKLHAAGLSLNHLGLRFGVSRPAIAAIVSRRSWAHVL